VTAHEPWAQIDDGEPQGVEVEIVKELAGERGAEIEWVRGNESELMQSAEAFELDLVIGGITEDSPWKDRVGMTRPYLEVTTRIAVPAGEPLLTELEGDEVAVRPGDAMAEKVLSEGGVPVPVEELRDEERPIAARDFEIEALGFEPTALELETEKHVMAVPPGENGWLLHVEKFLARNRAEIREKLVEEVRP
jgi:polar amino acid transport system substrate-binding protein